MKNILKILIILCIFISSCTLEPPYDFMTDKLAKIPIQDLPNRWYYAPEEGRDAGYYVLYRRDVYNENAMLDFIDKVENEQEAYVRKVDYVLRHYDDTIRGGGEAEPIFTDYYYNGKYYYVTIDNTRDVAAEDKKIAEYRYNNLVKYCDEENDETYYFITDLKEIDKLTNEVMYDEELETVFLYKKELKNE